VGEAERAGAREAKEGTVQEPQKPEEESQPEPGQILEGLYQYHFRRIRRRRIELIRSEETRSGAQISSSGREEDAVDAPHHFY